jgi:subtilisin family serine protease
MHSTIRKIISLGFICFFITSCGGGGGSEAAIAPKPSVNLSADPTSVLLENDSTLTWSSLNTTSCSATWTSKTSTSGSELVTIATPSNNAFSISCSGEGGTGQSSVTVEGYRNTSGVVVDGYISGAEVCIDEDNSWTCDADENSTVSDNNGNFIIKYAGGNLVSIGGMDLDSQTFLDDLLITHKLTDYSDFKAVTPVTSVAAFMKDSSLVNSVLGIDPSIDVFTFDPVANKGDGGINDYLYEKGNQLTVLAFAFQNIVNNLNATTETTQDYFQAITEEIEKEYSETNAKVDIEAESFISQALDNIIAAKSASIDENTKANTAKALASVLPVIQVNSSDYLTTSVIRFAVSTLQTDIQGIANGTASEEIIKSYTEDVLAHIAEDQNISANEITPNIFAIADAASTQEDTVVTIYVLLNDSYLNSAPISLTVSDGFNGTTAVTETFPKQISYSPDPDFNGTDTFSYTITQGDKIASADVTVTIEAVNDVPSINIASFRAAENQTAIGTVAATDAEGDAVTFTVSGTELAITSSGVLTFASAPDYETKTSYTATVTASDGTNSSTQDITVSVTNVNEAPIFTSSASFSAAENQTAIGSVSVVDSEDGTLTYSLSGTDASSLAISSSGVITFGSAPNYESKNSYSATIVASDGTNITTQAITVSVIDVNDVPVATAASYYMNLKPQSQTSGSITLAGTDEDGNTLAYSIVSNGIHGTASLSGTTVTYQTSASTQSAQSESFTFKVNDGTVDSSAATISIDLRTDPLYKYQWHLNNTGQTNFATNAGTSGVDLNVDTAISSGYTGNGVTVAVLDSGLEIAHEDLVDNIISGSYDFLNSDTDPTNPANDGDHGTSVAGLIAAKGWNNKGGRGVAPNASLIGYNYLKNQSLSNQLKAWGSNPPVSVDVDIYNMSYGTGYGVDENDDPNTTYNLPSYLSSSYIAGLTNGLSLRNNKGAIYIKSSGNDYGTSATSDCGSDLTCTDMMIDSYSAMPYIIHVGALQANGDVSSYTTPGSALWISGFGGQNGGNESIVNGQGYSLTSGIYKPAMMTVDQSGCTNGYAGSNGGTPYYNEFENPSGHSENSSCNYTSTFGGTSSAAPTVAGVVALMLEANPALTWRDVKHIIATTADQVGSDSDYTYILRGIKQYEWETNSAGYKFHNRFGFGKIDAAEAVTTAASYTANSRGTFSTAYVSSKPINLSINDNGTNTTSSLSITKPSGSNNFVEFIQLAVQFSHDVPKSIGIRLLSPDGTIINVMTPMTNIGTNPSPTIFEIGVAGLYGESIEGTWTLAVNDYIDDGTAGALTYWDIKVYGN